MVDALASFFDSITGSKRSTPRQSSYSSPPPQRRRSDDREEDGFVFLGNTHSERNQKDSNYQAEAPPTYDDSQSGLPTFQEAMAHRQQSRNPNLQPMSVPVQHSQPLQYADTLGYHPSSDPGPPRIATDCGLMTAEDIPFQLSPEAQILMDCADTGWMVIPPITQSNPAQYNYDFSHERAVIEEMNFPNRTQSSTGTYHQGRTDFTTGTSNRSGNMDSLHSRHNLISFD